MNSSENQQGDPNWALVNWDHPAAISSLDQATREYPANRSEWDWDPMTLAQHHGSGGPNDCSEIDSKNHLTHAGQIQACTKMGSSQVNSLFFSCLMEYDNECQILA
jgi:hypothetical protein